MASEDQEKNKKSPIALREEEVLRFWQENKIFEKSKKEREHSPEYVFYDGPPFATGLPHFGHILGSTIKDAVPRYQTMRGKRVDRRWGWDCHGLPIENIVEKDLKVSGKKQIEEIGIEKFNEYARSKVLGYVHDWKKTVDRIGRWVDFDGSYKTMDNTFIESVWFALGEMNKKGLLYEGTRVLPYCPRCETPIANSEIAMDGSYKDINDISAYVKFELLDEPGTFVLAWTTTPWTLPGNFALAVNPKIKYVKVKIENGIFVLAKDRIVALKDKPYEIVEEFEAKKIIGKSYKPLFPYFTEKNFPNKERAWKIYGAEFVTTTDGTGVVHIAPGYGEDDMNLSKKENIPFIHHVGSDGKFTADVTDFAGHSVKPKPTEEEPKLHQSGDVLIIKYLASHGTLFAKESILHSYPHCFRCETPLYYYAIPAWFIKIQDLKKKLFKLNKKIDWIPEHLKEGRFAKSMEGAPDWNISRNRYWASPLPIWKCASCKKIEIISSLSELRAKTSRGNRYFLVRHGQAESNLTGLVSCKPDDPYHLTEKGRQEVLETVNKLKKAKIDIVFVSDYVRTRETAEIICEVLKISSDKVIIDKRLREDNIGVYQGRTWKEYQDEYPFLERFVKSPEGGETLADVKKRSGDFMFDIDSRYSGKNILVVSHDTPMTMLVSSAEGWTKDEIFQSHERKIHQPFYFGEAEFREISFSPYPHNADYELDFHRPYIDSIKWKCECGGEVARIPEVIDCWFESASMPFAANHFPFENKEWFKKHFPADFVSEYIAQTRTWFYYMLVVSAILFDKAPFEHIVTTGNVLAEDGQKMSKSKGN
ncbi:MAG: class I tRNA ligase family protein, partial [Candidatus Pacebacteria bacterium]|nr:class I tRNA ligase family protein [Candidatus Paceibacterota bacterium]